MKLNREKMLKEINKFNKICEGLSLNFDVLVTTQLFVSEMQKKGLTYKDMVIFLKKRKIAEKM